MADDLLWACSNGPEGLTMRRQGYFSVFLVLSWAALFPSAAVAETIRITSGLVEMGTPDSPFNLVGDRRGFRLFGSHYNGGFGPNLFVFCPDDLCNPGAVAEIAHAANGLDLPATATLDGILFEDVGSLGARASAEMGFSGSLTLPPLGSSAVLHSPFTFEGSFFHDFELELLRGSGIVTSTWTPTGSDPSESSAWMLNTLRYDFFGATPVPEPTTLVLAGVAGAAAAFGRRKRRAR